MNISRLITTMAACTALLTNPTAAQNWRMSAGGGLALGEMKFLKKNMVCSEFLLGYEQNMKKGYQITASAGLSAVSFDFYDTAFNAVYNEKIFITVPVVLRKQLGDLNGRKPAYFLGLGVIGNWCYKDRETIKNYQSAASATENFTGFNLSMCMEVGRRIFISKKSSLSLALVPQVDLVADYSNIFNKIKLVKNLLTVAYSVNLGKTK